MRFRMVWLLLLVSLTVAASSYHRQSASPSRRRPPTLKWKVWQKLCDLETKMAELTQPQAWNTWGSWSPCSSPCGPGLSRRERTCDGQYCVGDATEYQACQIMACPDPGAAWDAWGSWSPCSSPCGPGLSRRERTCDGQYCVGDASEYQACQLMACPDPGADVSKSAFAATFAAPTETSIRFTHTFTNEGAHYNTSDGVFTCEYPGIYVFYYQLVVDWFSFFAQCDLMKNSDAINFAAVSLDSDVNENFTKTISNSAILHLTQGDTVYLDNCSPFNNFGSDAGSTFLGFLLFAD